MATHKERRESRLGETYGDLTVTGVAPKDFVVTCACGTSFVVRLSEVKSRGLTHCGCRGVRAGDRRGPYTVIRQQGADTRSMRANFIVECDCGESTTMYGKDWLEGKKPHRCWAGYEMVGKTFGRLTVVSFTGEKNAARNYIWNCSCVCGNVTQATTVDLNRGNKRSCGCLQKEIASARAKARFPRTEAPTYATAHSWIWDTKGPAAEHQCVQCGKTAQDWAYDGEDPLEVVAQFTHKGLAYSLNPDHYQPMCKPCHSAFDAQARRDRKSAAEADRLLKARIDLFGEDRVAEQDLELAGIN